jgi:3-oxoacyl-[acyl-carrier protein] reductase
MDSDLAGRVALITGASGGIGQQLARSFAAEGARVVIHYHRNPAAAEALSQTLPADRSMAVAADLTVESDVEGLFAAVESRFGPVEILVANAGIWPPESVPLQSMSLDQWNTTLTTDLTSVFLCLRAFFRGIERHAINKPAAVLIGSTAGIFGEAGHADYATAKAALIHGLLPTLKNELAKLAAGGRINVVCPGWTMTPMTEKFAGDPSQMQRALQTIALRKFATPEDVANAVLFFASSRLSGHLTGERLVVSGGMEGRVLNDE